MQWFARFFSQRRRYEDISISIEEHIEERTQELMADGDAVGLGIRLVQIQIHAGGSILSPAVIAGAARFQT